MDPSTTSTNGSSSPRSALKNHSRKSSAPPFGPHSKSIRGQCTAIFGSPGSAPSAISSMLGCVAAVSATESPSQLRPALIHKTWIKVSSALTAASVGICHSFLDPGWGPQSPHWTSAYEKRTLVLGLLRCVCLVNGSSRQVSVCRSAYLRIDPVVPFLNAFTCCRGQRQNIDVWVNRLCVAATFFKIEVHIAKQVDLVDDDQSRCGEHVWVLQRFVGALGHRDDDDFAVLAEVEHSRAYQIADVLDEQQRARLGFERVQRAVHHVGVEVAAGAGVDLNGPGARGADPLGVEQCLLIALDDDDRPVRR